MNRPPALVVALSIVAVACLGGASGGAAAPGAPAASGEARVDGKPLKLAHAYLFHAPDAWKATQVNAVALLTPKPLDEAKLRAATTLQAAFNLAPERVVVEVPPAGPKAELKICHPGFGADWCYTTTIYPPEWSVAKAAAGHLAGSVKTFTGEEEEVFQKHKLFYAFSFDAAPVRDFDRRR